GLQDCQRPQGSDVGDERRRSAERQERHLGLVPGWLQAVGGHQREGRLRDRAQERRRRDRHRLHPPPRAVPVLHVDGKPAPPASELRGDDWADRSGEPPVRPERLLGGRRRGQPACRVLPGLEVLEVVDRVDEEVLLVDTINHLQHLKTWKNTAVIVAYDDSDGWYDHVIGPIVSHSASADDALTGTGMCGTPKAGAY